MRCDARFEWADVARTGAAPGVQVLVRRRGSAVLTPLSSQADAKLLALLEADSIPQYIWPAATAMQQWVVDHQETFTGRTVLELGCGTGVVGFTVARYAKLVVLSDASAVSLAMALESLTHNGLGNCCVAALSWGREDQLARIKAACRVEAFDIVLGSDVFYFSSALRSGLVTARSVFGAANSDDAAFFCGSVARSERMETDLEEMPLHEGFELHSFVADGPFHLYHWKLARPEDTPAS